MNEFDQFVKHTLKIRHYARYTDDFVIVSDTKEELGSLVPKVEQFLTERLHLSLHLDKVCIRTHAQGIDFLGQMIFPHHRLLRTKTRRRIFSKLKQRIKQYKAGLISEETLHQSLQSYLGVLSHVDAYETIEKLKNQFWFWLTEN